MKVAGSVVGGTKKTMTVVMVTTPGNLRAGRPEIARCYHGNPSVKGVMSLVSTKVRDP